MFPFASHRSSGRLEQGAAGRQLLVGVYQIAEHDGLSISGSYPSTLDDELPDINLCPDYSDKAAFSNNPSYKDQLEIITEALVLILTVFILCLLVAISLDGAR